MAVAKARWATGTTVDVVIMEDFNRHDQLWGGDGLSWERQGEADPIVDLINERACPERPEPLHKVEFSHIAFPLLENPKTIDA